MKTYLHLLALSFAISPAFAIGASITSTQLIENAMADAFRPVVFVRHDIGEQAGGLYCRENACAAVQHSAAADEGFPAFLTAHTVRLGEKAPMITLECNGAGSLFCAVVEQGARPGEGKSLTMSADAIFAPGDGCFYTATSNDVDHVVRRKVCWEKGRLREQPQPLSYVGFKTTTNIRLTLYPNPKVGRPNHSIPAGRFVEILAAQPEGPDVGASRWILVRDLFGITGWVSVAALGGGNSCVEGRPVGIKGFCATGD